MPAVAIRVVLAAIVLTVLQTLAFMANAAITGEVLPTTGRNPLPWILVANLLDAAVLGWIALRSSAGGWRLALALGALLFGIAHFTSLVEARFFGFFDTAKTLGYLTTNLVIVIAFASLFVLMLRKTSRVAAQPLSWRPRMTVLRFVAATAAYLFTYFAAGLLVLPFIREFYAMKAMPDPLALIALQLLVRGPLFVALLYIVVRISRAGRLETMLMAGAALSIVGGIAPLMVPNPYFPDAVRWAHFVEVSVSNFIYGCFAGWLLTASQTVTAADKIEPEAGMA